MTDPTSTTEARPLTPAEVAFCTRAFRESRQWSQETLAELAGLTVRTIQRAEGGEGCSPDTKRALGVAFGLPDVDFFNKPHSIPTEEAVRQQREQFDRDHVVLPMLPLTTGRQLAGLVATSDADVAEPTFDLTADAASEFAALVDYCREYRECAELHTETDKLQVFSDLQAHIDALSASGVALCYGTRTVAMRLNVASESIQGTFHTLYILAFPAERVPNRVAVSRQVRFGF